jgi:Cu/Ag efflux pump CusA
VVKNLRKLKSVSRTGQSDVVLEFAWGTDMDQASLEVRDKLDVLRLPLEAKAPVLLRFNPSTEPVMRLVLDRAQDLSGSEQAELMRLRRYADNELKKKLEPVDGVAAIKVAGRPRGRVQVYVDADKLAQLNLPRAWSASACARKRQHLRRPHRGRQRTLPGAHRQPVQQPRPDARVAGDDAARRRARPAQGRRYRSRRATRNARR